MQKLCAVDGVVVVMRRAHRRTVAGFYPYAVEEDLSRTSPAADGQDSAVGLELWRRQKLSARLMHADQWLGSRTERDG